MMTLRRLNASVLSPLLAFPIAWAFGALLSQFHLLSSQGPWPTEMIAVVVAVPLAFVAGGLIGQGIAAAATAVNRVRVETRISERTFRRMLMVIVAIGLLEVAHQFAKAGTVPLLSGSIDAARFSQGGPTVILTDLLTVAAILALAKPKQLLARESRFELGIAAVSIGAFALQGGRGSVVLPIAVAVLARWFYWGRPSAYVLATGVVLAVLAISIGFYLRVYQHPTTPFEAELFGEILPPLPFFLKPLIPVYLAITTNFIALKGVIGHFPTVAPYGHGVYDAVAFDNFISGTQHIGDVSATTTPPWVTSTVAGPLWADGAFGWIVPGMALAGAVASGAYAAALRTRSFRWATAAAYLFFVALFGLYTNLWTQQIDWLIIVPLLLVFGAFAEDPVQPPGAVGRVWGKIRAMPVQQPPTTPPPVDSKAEAAKAPRPPRSYRAAAIAGIGAIAVLLVVGLAIQGTLPEPYPLVATKRLPASVASAQQVMTDGDHPGDNTTLWWVNRKGDRVTVRAVDPSRLKDGVLVTNTFKLPGAAGAKFDVGRWPPLRSTALFIFMERGNDLETIVWNTEKNRPYKRFTSTVSPPLPGAARDLSIASWAGKEHPDLIIIDRNEENSRVRLRVLGGYTGFKRQDLATTLPFRGLAPSKWALDVGSVAAGQIGEEAPENPIYRADIALIEKDPDRAHADLRAMLGEQGYEGFAFIRDLETPGDVAPDSTFLLGTEAGATSLYQVLPHTPHGPLLRIFSIEPITGIL